MSKLKQIILFLMGFSCMETYAQSFPELLVEAEKASASQKWPQAVQLWEKVNAQNPVHHNYIYQLGNAYFQAGNYNKALLYFEKGFHLTEQRSYNSAFNVARAYARMGDKNKALEWIHKSFWLGMPNRSTFVHTDFELLKNDPAYQMITGTTDVSRFNRVEGWRYDLQFLKDEITRKAYKVVRSYTREDLNKEVATIDAAIPQLSDLQITIAFIRLLVKLGDGHSMLYANRDNPAIRKCVPLEFYWFKEGLYVLQAEQKFAHLLGAKVLNIENLSPEDFFKALQPLLSKDNTQTPKIGGTMRMRHTALLQAFGLCKSPDHLQLQLLDRNGKVHHLNLQADSDVPSRRLWDGLPGNWVSLENHIPQKPFYLKNCYTPYWFEYLPKTKTLWFQYNQVLNDPAKPYPQFLDSLFRFIAQNEVEKLVIDLRNNNGGNGELSSPLIQHLIQTDKINQAGKLFVITGRKTFSAAGICISLLEKHTPAIFAGEPAGTSPNFVGEEFPFELPYSHLWGNVSDREHHYSNAIDYRPWIAPSIYVEPSFEDFIQGKDGVWEAILAAYPVK